MFKYSLAILLSFLQLCKQSDGVCNEDEFEYTVGPQLLKNNSFVYISILATNKGIGSSCESCSEWRYPDDTPVDSDGSDGLFLLDSDPNNLRVAGNCNTKEYCQQGIYKCIRDNMEILLLGVYKNNVNKILVTNMTLSMAVDDYFSSTVLSLNFECSSTHYPPTSVTWLKNNSTIENITTHSRVLVEALTSSYISTATLLQDYPMSDISGNYSCGISSVTLSDLFYVISVPVTIGDPPVLSVLEFINSTSVYIEWQHSREALYDHLIAYREVNSSTNETYSVDCGITNSCEITNLASGRRYLFVIAPSKVSTDVFQVTTQNDFIISEPNMVNVTFGELDSSGSLSIFWSPFATKATVMVAYTGTCGGISVCMNETAAVDSSDTSLTLRNLTQGIAYQVLVWGENAVGRGPEKLVMVKQTKKAPLSTTPLDPQVYDVTLSSINVTWNPLSCCEFSGEPPLYLVWLSTNETELYNDTSDEHYYLFEGLEPLTEYNISIATINSVGIGWWEIIQHSTLDNLTNTETSSASSSSVIPIITNSPTSTEQFDILLPLIVAIIGSVAILFVIGFFTCCIVAVIIARPKKVKNKQTAKEQNNLQTMELLNLDCNKGTNLLNSKYQAPYLIEFPTDTKAIIGETVHFLVHVEGFPQPSLSWEYQGEPVTPVGPVQIFTDGSLILNDVKPQYSGRYMFIASNPAGTVNRVINLKVVNEEDGEEDDENDKIRDCRSVVIEHKPVPVELLEKYVETHHEMDNDPFHFLFTSLRIFPESYSLNKSSRNKERNRYKNIVPYDENIVELIPIQGWKNCEHSYINASYIDGFNSPRKFIATQGPLAETVLDFWRMVHQEKCRVIVTLCNLREGNKVKCEQYWPESTNKPEEHGPYVVRLLSEELNSNFIVRNMEILLSDGSQDVLSVKQFHLTSWPDHGVPEHGSPLIQLHQKVMRQLDISTGPIIVHCSAGVGRTGTFIALDIALEQIKAHHEVDFVGIVNHMREQRMKMVQISQQLIFLHDVVLEFVLCGSTLISIGSLSEALTRLYTENPHNAKTGFETQFQLIQRLTPKLNKFKCSVGKQYIEKNRPNIALPLDSRRVVLYGQSTDYINASYIDGFEKKKAFIVAQSPLQQTIIDFWRMIVQQKSSVVVMLCELAENSKVICSRYWPLDSKESEVFGCFSIKILGEKSITESLFKRTLGVKDMNTGISQVVTQIQVKNWLPDGQCPNHQTICDLHGEVTCALRSRAEASENPVVVHCSDSVTRSGMYCATHIAIDQARLEQVVDIFQVVKNVRMQRPGSVPTEGNYITIHDFVKAYFTSFEIYQMQGIQIYNESYSFVHL